MNTTSNNEEDTQGLDAYPDSETELTILRGVKVVKVLRAVIQWYSNVGYFVRIKGVMVAVNISEEGNFFLYLPRGGD